MRALIIVDVQNDFLPGGALGVPQGDQIISVINDLQQKFDQVIATKDWHPSDHISFAVHHGKKPGEVIKVHGKRQELWPIHCVQKTRGAEFAPGLNTEKIGKIFYKGTDRSIDSYSAFFDNAHDHSTGLGEYLKDQGIEEIYIVGLATDYCVKFSVLDAAKLGFKIFVVIDGCKGIDLNPGDVDRALKEIQESGATILENASVH